MLSVGLNSSSQLFHERLHNIAVQLQESHGKNSQRILDRIIPPLTTFDSHLQEKTSTARSY